MNRISRTKAIRAKCLDCCCGQQKEVRLCPISDCPLFPYRMGREDRSVYEDSSIVIDENLTQNEQEIEE